MSEPTFRNPLKQRLEAGRAITMAIVTMPSVAAMQVWARSGIDALCIDMEHGPMGIESVHAMVAACGGAHGVPIVRVPWNVPWLVKPVLDTGAQGVIVPMIDSAEDAAAAVRAVRYPPRGERGWGPFYAHMAWNLPLPRYVATADDEIFTILLIERPEAIRAIDEIVKTPGVDMYVIAPFDLSVIMGYPGQVTHPEVQAAIGRAEAAILGSGVPLCGAAFTPEAANRLLEKGYRGLFLGFDWMVLQKAASGLLDGIDL